MRIALIECTSLKNPSGTPRELYAKSLTFQRKLRYVESVSICDEWFVLSALHHLVPQDVHLQSYDFTLLKAGNAVKRAWAATVVRQIDDLGVEYSETTFEILAGQAYFGWGLEEGLTDRGARVEIPTRGMPQGVQRRWFKEQVGD